jgi:hypothetical protein
VVNLKAARALGVTAPDKLVAIADEVIDYPGSFPLVAQSGSWRAGRAGPLCPGISDINLFRYCQSVIDFDAEIADRAFDFGMSEQELDSPEIAGPSIDQGRFRAPQ